MERPYVAYLDSILPKLQETTANTKYELKSFSKLAKRFGSIETGQLVHKYCGGECALAKKCTRKCLERKLQWQNEKVTVKNPTTFAEFMQTFPRGINLDTIVLVADRQFACHALILTMYSAYLRQLIGHTMMDLRTTPVTPAAFEFVYKWMLRSVSGIPRSDLLPILRAANFLEIPPLIDLCFGFLNGDEFKEIEAFHIMFSLRTWKDLAYIGHALAPRISESSLTVMCSYQFLQLTIDQICSLLLSSFLSVNTECEILFCALHWLDVDWPSRRTHLLEVLKCIRFAFLSPKLLSQLLRSGYENIGRFRTVLTAFYELPQSKQLIEEAIFYNTIVITMNCNRTKLEHFPNVKKELLLPRRWIQDIRCSYHRPVTEQCPNMHYITYRQFVQYSEKLLATIDNNEVFIDHPGYSKPEPKKFISSHSKEFELSFPNHKICDQLLVPPADGPDEDIENQTKSISLNDGFDPSQFWDQLGLMIN